MAQTEMPTEIQAEAQTEISVAPIAGAIGAEIAGVDIAKLVAGNGPDAATVAVIRDALLAHNVVFFRDQALSPESQATFGRAFGSLNRHPYVAPIEGHPDVFEIVKNPEDGHHFGNGWHTDLAYRLQPALGSLLYGIEIPPAGGDTLFANLYAAWDALSEGMQALLAKQRIVFTNANTYTETAPRFADGGARDMNVQTDEVREVAHPAMRVHPETGRKALYLSPIHAVRFEGMSVAESRPLLDFLRDHATQPEFVCRFHWQPGSLAFWDNRCTMHYAVSDFPDHRRVMQRVTVEGDTPV